MQIRACTVPADLAAFIDESTDFANLSVVLGGCWHKPDGDIGKVPLLPWLADPLHAAAVAYEGLLVHDHPLDPGLDRIRRLIRRLETAA